MEGGVKEQHPLRRIQHEVVRRCLFVGEFGGSVAAHRSTEIIVGQPVHSQRKCRSSCALKCGESGFPASGQGLIDTQGVSRSVGLFQKAGDFDLDAGIVRSVPGGDQKLIARLVVFTARNQVLRHLQANLAAPVVAIALPGTIQRRLVIEDRLAFVACTGRKTSQFQVNRAVPRRRLPQRREVGRRFLDFSRLSQRSGQLDLRLAARHVSERGTKIVNGDRRMAVIQGSLSSRLPPRPEFLSMVGERTEKKQGQGKEDGGDQKKRQQRNSILKDQPAASEPLFRREDRRRVGCCHRL